MAEPASPTLLEKGLNLVNTIVDKGKEVAGIDPATNQPLPGSPQTVDTVELLQFKPGSLNPLTKAHASFKGYNFKDTSVAPSQLLTSIYKCSNKATKRIIHFGVLLVM